MNERTIPEGSAIDFRTARDIVARELGTQVYHKYMDGAMSEWYGVDIQGAARVLSIVYGQDETEIKEWMYTHAKSYKEHLVRKQHEDYKARHPS